MELPRRSDHGQQPDGRPPRLGPDVQGRLPALSRHAGRGPALAERVRLPGTLGRGQRRAGPRLYEQARYRGLRNRRIRLALQAACPDLRRAPDRAVRPARDVDGLERPGRVAPAARPARRGSRPAGDDPGCRRSGERQRGDARRAARDARCRRQLFHVQQREQRPDLGVPGRVPPAGLDLQGPRHDAVVRPLRDWPLRDGDERGLRRSGGPRPDRPLPACGAARRSASRVDDHAVDADLQRRGGSRQGPDVRPCSPGRRHLLAGEGDAQDRPQRSVRGPRGASGRRPRRVALRRPV